jgi:alpha-galactosidase
LQDLYKAHPDWCLHVPNAPRLVKHNEMVLDLSRSDVRDYLFQVISNLLSR